ncbi:TonB-dependent receptor domain-containing protein [Roseivirga pacifica]|uniref:TonB-dependent receptor domain-containing protein n=1 Tax=Roseivirga pacifica TaxID=1267423 RepID=UPI00209619B5|nr:TonB-dependent receptor [Roseivirga pacifica]MCO6359337.1 TonB-dependent receptor plug domain-containing protein [Roseivirga pacifica]MCO6366707.1 TonB-dependent receptor plug domain-containing protein [Roseivirga pacifica]MCO6370761.1 TonB-dependent receptor plug domain-containing protein [Roseivirga pacifica]MCO6374363.1 TonB-dependent receptor plug domain-containing protein [Roseivirga pacifica]MCO6379622.1 TonB-dependent receptor plug domain-containing protein [Roseivirga pacifica]
MKNFKHVFVLIALSIAQVAFAQNGTVRGTIIEDSNGEPMYGVTVILLGTSNGAITDFDGKFSVNAPAGTYQLQASFIGFQKVIISDLVVKADEVTVIDQIRLKEDTEVLEEVVVTAEAIRTSEVALLTQKRKSANVLDGISSESFRRIGDSNAGEAAKRITGVSVEGGKYIYVRGLGDRYTKTTLNGMDIPGLDPDRNSIQIDVFPTNMIDNMLIVKSFTPELPADFTGGIVNIETKDFPDQKIFDISLSVEYNPAMHLNSDYITYDGSNTDFLGFDNGERDLPSGYDLADIPTPFNSTNGQVSEFLNEFSPTLGVSPQTSPMNYNFGFTYADQKELANGNTLGYMFTGNYKNNTTFYDDAFYGEYQNDRNTSVIEFQRAATTQGLLAENNVLLGGLAGLAYKTSQSKYRLTLMRLQNGVSRSGDFDLVDDEDAIGKSGYIGISENLEYNERQITNLFLNGEHHFKESGWTIDWRAASTWSSQDDPDIRKTAFTRINDNWRFAAGAAGNPSRLWRALDEVNTVGKVDLTKDLEILARDAKLKFGVSHTYKERDYSIVDFNINFYNGQQLDWAGNASEVWTPQTLYPDGSVYLVSGFSDPNPNEYNSNINNTGAYVSTEFSPAENLKAIIGVRAENFVQRHTGRDQLQTVVLDNDIVLDDLNFFPSVNFIYALQERQNLRASYSKTIARPSFKELSFAQILDPVSNRIFNGGLFAIDDWDGNLQATHIDNFDIRWELFMNRGQNLSFSAFYKSFKDPIELVLLPQAQTNTELQPRNVGDGRLYGIEMEFKKSLDFISDQFSLYGNFTFVESAIDMSATELRTRNNNARDGEVIEDTRNMAGQAPWIVNAGLAYDNYEKGIDAGLFYNVKGKTLVVVGGGINPDVFSQPFNSLNFNMNKVFGEEEQWALNFSISNILGDKMEQFYERSFSNLSGSDQEAAIQTFQRFNPGTSFGLGIKYSF